MASGAERAERIERRSDRPTRRRATRPPKAAARARPVDAAIVAARGRWSAKSSAVANVTAAVHGSGPFLLVLLSRSLWGAATILASDRPRCRECDLPRTRILRLYFSITVVIQCQPGARHGSHRQNGSQRHDHIPEASRASLDRVNPALRRGVHR